MLGQAGRAPPRTADKVGDESDDTQPFDMSGYWWGVQRCAESTRDDPAQWLGSPTGRPAVEIDRLPGRVCPAASGLRLNRGHWVWLHFGHGRVHRVTAPSCEPELCEGFGARHIQARNDRAMILGPSVSTSLWSVDQRQSPHDADRLTLVSTGSSFSWHHPSQEPKEDGRHRSSSRASVASLRTSAFGCSEPMEGKLKVRGARRPNVSQT